MAELGVKEKETMYDVLVIGGGPAGCAAAIAAARHGVKTALLESSYTLGGMGTIGLVNAWCPFSDHTQMLYRGIAKEVFDLAKETVPHEPAGKLDWVAISAEGLKRVYDQLVLDSGTEIRFGTLVCSVSSGEQKIHSIVAAGKDGLTAYRAKVYIDCTGDGDVAAFAGVPFQKGGSHGELQPASLCFIISNVDERYYQPGQLHSSNKESPVYKMLASERYPLIEDAHFNDKKIGPGTVGLNAGHLPETDTSDPAQVTRSMIRGRAMAEQFHRGLREYLPEAFGNSYLAATAPVLGVRETRRIEGLYTLTYQDYLDRKTFGDEIGRNCYYVDVHGANRKFENRYQPGESHGIPYRCLVPKGMDNLLVAGRAISCDHIVMGSTRVMPNCLTTGQAAGTAAVLSVRNTCPVSAVDTSKLRQVLRRDGAYLPE